MRALSLVLVLGAAATAHAQDLFRAPGGVSLAPTGTTYSNGQEPPFDSGILPLASDAAGYLYYAAGGGLSCHHPSDPLGTYRLFSGDDFRDGNGTIIGVRSVFAVAKADGPGVVAAFVPGQAVGVNAEALRIFDVSCPDLSFNGQGGTGGVRLGDPLYRAASALYAGLGDATFIERDATTYCFASTSIICIDLGVSPPTVTALVDAAGLDDALRVDPGDAVGAWLGAEPPAAEGWALSALSTAPDGRVFFIADRLYRSVQSSPGVSSHYHVRYIVERATDGALRVRYGPVLQGDGVAGFDQLAGVSQLFYDPTLDAMLAWPVQNNEFNLADWNSGVEGWNGYGFRVLPLAGRPQQSGYLGVSAALAPLLAPCLGGSGTCAPLGVTMFAGKLLLAVGDGRTSGVHTTVYEVHFDPARLDLDDDGLSATEEAAAGTSDTLADSDGGGTPDGTEVRVAKTDPTSPSAEPGQRERTFGTIHYVPSPLIRTHLPAFEPDLVHQRDTLSAGVLGPYCLGGECFDADGDLVARYPIERALPGTRAVVAYDGTFVMLETVDGLVRYWFDDAREELAVSRHDLDAYVPSTVVTRHVIPIDGERTWIAADGGQELSGPRNPAVVALAAGDTVRVMYDHAQAQRDSGLAVATDDRADRAVPAVAATISVIGWDDVTEQLYLGVSGVWDTYLIGVGADGSVTRLERGRALAGLNVPGTAVPAGPPPLPLYLVPTGHGDFYTPGVMEPFGGYRPTSLVPLVVHAGGVANTLGVEQAPRAFWGDVLLQSVCCGFNEDGFYELVRYDDAVAPGDVLVLLPAGSGAYTLYRSGPRGGLSPVWGSASTDIREVAGMDLASDGSMRLCVADEGAGMLWELEPAGPRGAPEIIRYSQAVPGIADCGYTSDGTLEVLARGPARLLVRPGAGDPFADLAPGDALAAHPEPIALVHTPDDTLEVRLTGDGLRGKAYLPDGRAITMRDGGFEVRIDDALVGGLRLIFQNYLGVGFPDDWAARVALVARPDGRIVAAAHHAAMGPVYATLGEVMVLDSAGASELGMGSFFASRGVGLAVVPGGSAADPWTGRRAAGTPSSNPPGGPPPPTGGEQVTASGDAKDGGCGGAASSSEAVLVAFALANALSRRRAGG